MDRNHLGISEAHNRAVSLEPPLRRHAVVRRHLAAVQRPHAEARHDERCEGHVKQPRKNLFCKLLIIIIMVTV